MSKATAYSVSATGAGAVVGASLGAGGAFLGLDFRVALAALLAVAAVVIGGLELHGKIVPVLQWDRETPQAWLHSGALRWATRNGVALGIGSSSRIGFWLWYVVPVAAVLVGSPILGAVFYGTYGFVLGTAVWGIILGPARWMGTNDAFAEWILYRFGIARKLASGMLVVVGIVIVLTVGI